MALFTAQLASISINRLSFNGWTIGGADVIEPGFDPVVLCLPLLLIQVGGADFKEVIGVAVLQGKIFSHTVANGNEAFPRLRERHTD